ncbi:hypothetical protein K502DRAFT_350221 [Neoconidiobolus thromboides FSU 785]|nr:hypothetical protein K502DRAFT_350221 [Neoconidiobolus thromboides FSU 785]
MKSDLFYSGDNLFRDISQHISYLDPNFEASTNNFFESRLKTILSLVYYLNCFSSTFIFVFSLKSELGNSFYLFLNICVWSSLVLKTFERLVRNAKGSIYMAIFACLLHIMFDIMSGFRTLNEHNFTGDSSTSILVYSSWALPEFTFFFVVVLLMIINLYEKDRLKLQAEIRNQFMTACVATENSHKSYINKEVQIIRVFVEELRTIVAVIQEHSKTLALFGESNVLDSNNCKVFELKLDTFFKHFSKICNVLTSYRDLSSGRFLGFVASYKSKNRFDVTNVLQLCGDILGKHAAREKLELIINDLELVFTKLFAYGEGIALNHILVRMLNFAIQSALPNSSIELGVKIPKSKKDKDAPIDVNTPISFIFTVSYSTSSSTDIIDLNLDMNSPLVLLSKQVGAKLTYFGDSNKKTIYIKCTFVMSEECHAILNKSFDENVIEHPSRKLFLDHELYLVTSQDSTFGNFLNSCFKLLGANIDLVPNSTPALSRCLRTLNDKSIISKDVCFIINDCFTSFQTIIHDILLRNTGDHCRRVNNTSIIYLLSPDSFPEVFQFLETTLSQCHSLFYPCITLIPKPVGFRLFVDLYVSHVNASQNSYSPGRFRLFNENKSLSQNKIQSPEIKSPRSPHSPRPLHRHSNSNGSSSSIKPEVLVEVKSPEGVVIPKIEDPEPLNPSIPNVVVTDEKVKSSPTPLSKLLSKSKQSRTAAKLAKLNKQGKKDGPMLSPNSAKRPGANSGSYFPQVQSLPINVLIVEDNPINQKILATFMKKRKIKYAVANDGQEAVEKWKKGGFHIVLMDIQLPVMDGIEATKEIRKIEKSRQISFFSPPTSSNSEPMKLPTHSQPNTPSPRTPPTPIQSPVIIVALTASSLRTDRIDALAAGCNDFLTKPVSLVWLEKKIMEWGCMQALIDIEGWRRLKYSKASSPTARNVGNGPSTAPTHHGFPLSKLPDPTRNFNMRSEAMLSKLKKAEEKKRGTSPVYQ